MRDGSVVRVRGDRDNPFSRGFICPKGSALQRIHEDPDRLRQPLVRRGDDPATATWEEVSWPEAYAEIERGLLPIIEKHGRDAVGVYLGNPNAHTLGRRALRAAAAPRTRHEEPVLGEHGRPDAQARVERAAVRQRARDSRSPTSTAPTTC